MITALVWIAPAFADTTVVADADETPSALDIRSVTQTHEGTTTRQRLLSYAIETQEPWDAGTLDDAETWNLSLHFDLDGEHELAYRALGFCGEGFERVLEIRVADDGSLYGEMRTRREKVTGFAKAWRPSDTTMNVSFPKSALGPGLRRGGYRWCVQTAYHESSELSSECGESDGIVTLCTDRVPDRSAARHNL